MLDDRFGSKAVICWALVLFLVSALGVLSVDKSHVLFVLPIEARLPGSAPLTSVGEQVYLAFAILIGVASGPIQSASRTLLARLSPRTRPRSSPASSHSPARSRRLPRRF